MRHASKAACLLPRLWLVLIPYAILSACKFSTELSLLHKYANVKDAKHRLYTYHHRYRPQMSIVEQQLKSGAM